MKNAWCSLEPLRAQHAQELCPASQDPSIWQHMPTPVPRGVDGMLNWIEARLETFGPLQNHPFLVRDADGQACGSTSLFDLHQGQLRGEVGWTWYGVKWQGTKLNKACKRLILEHAFEGMGLRRVQLKCDSRNERSFNAMLSIGATHEGTLRRHDEMWDGHIRDAEVFSITDLEWPNVREDLDARLAQV